MTEHGLFGNHNVPFDEDEMDTISIHDLDDLPIDYYESQPGDVVSTTTNHKRARKHSIWTLAALTLGTILILCSILYSMYGNFVDTQPIGGSSEPLQTDAPITSRTDAPIVSPQTPTQAPTVMTHVPTASPIVSTTSPTTTMESIIVSLIGSEALSDTNSPAYTALRWLEQDDNSEDYTIDQIKQRFALTCLYLGTNLDSTWVHADAWMSDVSECLWYGVECKDDAIIALNLTANGLEGIIPGEITLLRDTLLSLELATNDLVNANQELAWIGELTKLRMLDLANTYFSYNGIPTYIANLVDLRVLDVSETMFTGPLDGSIFASLTQLAYLEIGGNIYNSSLPDDIIHLPELEALYLYDTGLIGDLEFLPSMSEIVELWVDSNPLITGTIPTEIGLVSGLASISVSNCNLHGQIPSEIGVLSHMEQMWFNGNWFTGSIPTEFGNLPKLQILGFENNNITHVSMPQEICDLDLVALSADCGGAYSWVDCDCCTCCEYPCPVASLPTYNQSRKLYLSDQIRRG